jgi:cyclophilin family peptidyl-prolyl cis-trans isomerase
LSIRRSQALFALRLTPTPNYATLQEEDFAPKIKKGSSIENTLVFSITACAFAKRKLNMQMKTFTLKKIWVLPICFAVIGCIFLIFMLRQSQLKEEPTLNEPTTRQTEAPAGNPQVVLETSLGAITLELDPAKAPLTVNNFLNYVNAGFYNGTIFHRVIPGFMIQGGGMTPGLKEKSTEAPIKNEAANGLTNLRGTIAMARTQVIDSATSQFFINVNDNLFLNHSDNSPNGFGYCVFGKVISGLEVTDKIVAVPTQTSGYHENVPVKDVLIIQAHQTK